MGNWHAATSQISQITYFQQGLGSSYRNQRYSLKIKWRVIAVGALFAVCFVIGHIHHGMTDISWESLSLLNFQCLPIATKRLKTTVPPDHSFPASVCSRIQSSAPPVKPMPSGESKQGSDQMKEWGMSLSAVLYKSFSPCRFAEIKLSIFLILTITVLPWLATIFTNIFSWIVIRNKGIYILYKMNAHFIFDERLTLYFRKCKIYGWNLSPGTCLKYEFQPA